MVNLTLSEATLNAVRAALEERVARLALEVERLQTPPREEFNERACPACGAAVAADDTHWSIFVGVMGEYVCPDWQRALVWNTDALLETQTAVEDFAEVNLPEQSDPITAAKSYAEWEAWTEGELVAEFGR